MSNVKLPWLADEIRKVWPGHLIFERPGWKTYTSPTSRTFSPKGLMNHHTAGSSILKNYPQPPYWTADRLKDSCNITVRPDGRIDMTNAGYAYDSGMGSSEVLWAVTNNKPLPPLSGLTSNISANPHYIDIEVQHLGDGSYIEPVQYLALMACNVAICRKLQWDPRFKVIGHRESAPDRKIDPRWGGMSNPMAGIRADTYRLLIGESDMLTPAEETFVKQMYAASQAIDPKTDGSFVKFLIPWFRKWSGFVPENFAPAGSGGGATPDETIAELVRRIQNG